ncbi:hypothetical protein CNR22_17245 [Sphingobacteriaceae bacterium]|nr:hypothetical protein CNR22_17245 [Sphingobacteriaceae bacterium]
MKSYKTSKLILILAITASVFSACRKGGPWGIKGKGENVTETRSATGFDQIDHSIDADIYYTQDSIYKVEISAQPNILAVLKTEVKNGILFFDYRRNVWDHNTVKITIHAPKLKEIALSGSGDMNFQNEIIAADMKIKISGLGEVYFPKLTAQNLNINISGSGSVKIADGAVKSENCEISGLGSVDALGLVAENAELEISGSGDMKVNVTENLDISISGSGSVSYKGNPRLSKSISGSGKVIHLN